MLLSAEQLQGIVDFADGEEVRLMGNVKGAFGSEVIRRLKVERVSDKERIYIYETGQIERIPDNG